MTYQQFLTEIQLQIHSLFDTDVTIQLHKIQKNNGVTLDGLTILQKGCNISPTIYLNDYYKEYQAGKGIGISLLSNGINGSKSAGSCAGVFSKA